MLHHTTDGAIGRPVKQARGQTRAVYHEDASHHAIRMHDPLRDESLSVELSPGRSGAGVTRLGSYTDVASQQVGLFLSLSLSFYHFLYSSIPICQIASSSTIWIS